MSGGIKLTKKQTTALSMIRVRPLEWLRHDPIEVRDLALINANPVPFVKYGQPSYVRKLYYRKTGDMTFHHVDWTVENNENCMEIVTKMGGSVVGFTPGSANSAVNDLSYTLVNVNIDAAPKQGFGWGFLSTRAENVRIFRGPSDTCDLHPWDAMILRDCTTNAGSISAVEEISSRKWDILAMKMCEDYDHPWLVVAVHDSGLASDAPRGLPDCCCVHGRHPGDCDEH